MRKEQNYDYLKNTAEDEERKDSVKRAVFTMGVCALYAVFSGVVGYTYIFHHDTFLSVINSPVFYLPVLLIVGIIAFLALPVVAYVLYSIAEVFLSIIYSILTDGM